MADKILNYPAERINQLLEKIENLEIPDNSQLIQDVNNLKEAQEALKNKNIIEQNSFASNKSLTFSYTENYPDTIKFVELNHSFGEKEALMSKACFINFSISLMSGESIITKTAHVIKPTWDLEFVDMYLYSIPLLKRRNFEGYGNIPIFIGIGKDLEDGIWKIAVGAKLTLLSVENLGNLIVSSFEGVELKNI